MDDSVIEIDSGRLARLEDGVGHRFRDLGLLARALTHPSFAHEHPPRTHHEALALLGDAALSLAVAEHLHTADPDAPVGVLTSRRAEIVSGANLARWATALELGGMLRLGRGEEQTGGRARASILATTLEAVLGAIYLEAGPETLRAAVARLAGW